MERATKAKIISKIKVSPKGKLFIISDFESLGNYGTVCKGLADIEKIGLIERILPGIYLKPEYDKYSKRWIAVSPIELAETIARKNQWTIAPSKNLVLLLLGLDSHMIGTYNFISDGPTTTIRLGNAETIKFQHASNREINMDATSSLIIQSFKQLGEKNISDEILLQLKISLSKSQIKQLVQDGSKSRIWIRQKVKELSNL